MKKDKLVKKEFVVAAVQLMVYAVFLVRQVILSQVLCYKADGSVDLESAYLGIQCECKNTNHNHECKDKDHDHINKNVNHPGDGGKDGVGVKVECCFDVPVNADLLTNESNSIFLNTTLAGWYNVHVAKQTILPDPYTGLPEQIPISKFIIQFPFLCSTVILRC